MMPYTPPFRNEPVVWPGLIFNPQGHPYVLPPVEWPVYNWTQCACPGSWTEAAVIAAKG